MAGGSGNFRVTTLDPGELTRVRALLAEQAPVEPSASGQSYPRMLFHGEYVSAAESWKKDVDPLMKKVAAEKMQAATIIVFDAEEEAEFLAEGWRKSPADFMENDPRIPVGREAKRAAAQQGLSREQEIQALTLRLAELRGDPAVVPAAAIDARPAPTAKPRRRKVRRSSRVPTARRAIADAFGEPSPSEQS